MGADDDVQLMPWKPYFLRPRRFATSWRMAYMAMCSGMVRWKEVSKYAIELAFGSASMHALITDSAPPLCLARVASSA